MKLFRWVLLASSDVPVLTGDGHQSGEYTFWYAQAGDDIEPAVRKHNTLGTLEATVQWLASEKVSMPPNLNTEGD